MDATELLSGEHMLLLGDIMLDEYTWGRAERVSPEAPVLVVQADTREVRLGGAGAVAGLLRGLSAEVLVGGVVGNDHEGYTVRRLLEEAGIDGRMSLTDADRPTTHKQRFLATVEQRQPHQILRVDHERTHPLSTELGERLAEAILLGAGLRPRTGLDRRSAESGRPAVGGFGEVGRHAPSGHVGAVLISDCAKGVCTPDSVPWLVRVESGPCGLLASSRVGRSFSLEGRQHEILSGNTDSERPGAHGLCQHHAPSRSGGRQERDPRGACPNQRDAYHRLRLYQRR